MGPERKQGMFIDVGNFRCEVAKFNKFLPTLRRMFRPGANLIKLFFLYFILLTREPLLSGRLSTIDLLVETCLDQLLFLQNLFYKTSYLNEVSCEPPLSVSFSCFWPGNSN